MAAGRRKAGFYPPAALLAVAALAACQPYHPVTMNEVSRDYLDRVNSGADYGCDPAIANAVATLGVPLSDFTQIRVYRDQRMPFSNWQWTPQGWHLRHHDDDDPLAGYTAWVDMKSCKGNLALRFDTVCRQTSAFTSGDCQLPAMPAR